MKTWIKENEPLLRFVEVLLVGLFGSYLAYAQLGMSRKQSELAERSLAVSHNELKLLELQTDFQRMDHLPYFTFFHSGINEVYLPSIFEVNERNEREVRSLAGIAKLYLVVTIGNGKPRLILLDSFYRTGFRSPETGKLNFNHDPYLIFPRFFGIDIANYGDKYLKLHAMRPEEYPMPFTIHNYVELTYVSEDSRRIVQRFDMKFPHAFPTPVAEEPKYDRVIDLNTFLLSDHDVIGGLGADKVGKEITNAIAELSKG